MLQRPEGIEPSPQKTLKAPGELGGAESFPRKMDRPGTISLPNGAMSLASDVVERELTTEHITCTLTSYQNTYTPYPF